MLEKIYDAVEDRYFFKFVFDQREAVVAGLPVTVGEIDIPELEGSADGTRATVVKFPCDRFFTLYEVGLLEA